MKTFIEADRIDHLDIARTHNPRRGTRRFMGSTGAAAVSRAMRKKSKSSSLQKFTLFVDGIEGVEIPASAVPFGDSTAWQYALGFTEEGDEPSVYRRGAWQRGTFGGWRWEMFKDKLLKQNPRRGTRRFGGSTQAAARARRAPAPAAPAPAAAPKKTRATKAKTVKSRLSPASLKMLLEATTGTLFSTWDNNKTKRVFIGSVTINGTSRPVVTNGYALVFTDTIPEKTAKLLRRNVNYSEQQPNIEGISDKVQQELRDSVEATSELLKKSRLDNAIVKRGKIVAYNNSESISITFKLPSGEVIPFDLQKLKHLALITGATRLEIGNNYAFFYKNNVLVALVISLDKTKGGERWKYGTESNAFLVAIGEQKPEIIKAPNLKTSPLRVKLSKIPGRTETLGGFFSFDARKVTISNTENWLFCTSGGLSQAHMTTAAQKFFSDYLQGFTGSRSRNYNPNYDPQQREFIDNLLRNARNAQAAFFDRVVEYEDEYLGRKINKGVQVIANDRTIGRLFAIDRIKFLAKYLYFDELRLHNSLLYLFYKGMHVGLITPLRAGGEIIE